MKKLLLLTTIVASLVLGGCSLLPASLSNSQSKEFEVAVSILPYVDIVERIAGEEVGVFSIVPEGYSPETYEPSPQEMKRLANARVVFLNGNLPSEERIKSVLLETNENVRVVELNTALAEEEFLTLLGHSHAEEHADEHSNTDTEDKHMDESGHSEPELMHNEDEHDARTIDPHTWLSPRLVLQQLPLIVQTLQEVDPESADVYLQNGVTVATQIEELQNELQAKLDKHWGRSFLVYHPAFGYFARDFNLEQHFIEIEGKEPSASQMKDSIEAIREENISAVFLEKQFATRTADSLAQELGVPVMYVNPLSDDYFGLLRDFTDQLLSGF